MFPSRWHWLTPWMHQTRARRHTPRLRLEELESRLVPVTWTSTPLSLFGDTIGVNVTPNGHFFASDGFDINRSVDQGSTWSKVTGFATFAGGAIAYAPSNPATMIAGRGHGTLKSVDGGANWFELVDLNAGSAARAIVFQPDNELVVYAGVGFGWGLYKSTNGGATWTNPLPSKDIFAVALDPQNPQVLYVGSQTYSQYVNGVMKSTDGGATWTTILPNTEVQSLVVDPANSQQIYAGTKDGSIYKSSNGGTNWTEITGSTIVTPVSALVFDPQNSSHLYAATSGEGVFYSPDGGATWSAQNQGLTDLNVAAMAVQSVSPYNLLVATYGGKAFWTTVPNNPWVTLSVTPASFSENGTATVTATLSAVSNQDVTVELGFSGTASNPADYTRSATQIVIQAGQTTGTITLTAVQDTQVEGNETIAIDITSVTNGTESGVQQVTATITDDDVAGFTITQTGGNTTVAETGTTDTFSVVLDAQPVSNVVFTLSSNDTGEATVSPATLVFTPDNWDTAQTVTVTGVDDASIDGDQTSTITVAVDDANSDNAFDSLADQSVSVITTDDDAPLLTLSVTTPLDEGQTATLTGTITNPPAEPFQVEVDWGEGDVETIELAGGATSFMATHVYADDNPTGTATDNYTITGRIPGAAALVSGTITNWHESGAVMRVGDGENRVSMWWSAQDFNHGFFYGRAFTQDSDVAFASGISDINQITDASIYSFTTTSIGPFPDAGASGNGVGSFIIWRNINTGHYGVLRVDDIHSTGSQIDSELDGTWWFQPNGTGNFASGSVIASATTSITVRNVTPTVDAGPDVLLGSSGVFTRSGSFADPGSLDTFTGTVNYGDGSGDQTLTLKADKTFDLNHTYATAGTYTITITISDDDTGVGSDSVEVRVDGTLPTVSNFSPADDSTGVALDINLVITFSEDIQKGSGNIVIKKSSDNSVVETIDVAEVAVAASTATINPSVTLAESTGYYIEVSAGAFKDLTGNDFAGISGSTTWNFISADLTPPEGPVVTGITTDTGASASDGVTSDQTLVISGTAEANSTVTVLKDSLVIGTVGANASGEWSFDYTDTTLAAGTYAVTARTTDLAGNISADSAVFTVVIDTTTPETPVVTGITTDSGAGSEDGITQDTTLVISGTAEANSTVTIFKDGTSIGTTSASESGTWSLDYTATTLPDGTHIFTARATDLAGNTSSDSTPFTVVVDTTAPTSSVVALPDLSPSADFTVSWQGTDSSSGIASYDVFVSIDGEDFSSWLTGTTDTTATYTGSDGHVYSFYSIATDVAGNREAAPPSGQEILVDTVAPTSTIAALPITTRTPNFLVSWSGTDTPGGSGIVHYDVFVSTDGGPFVLWQDATAQTSATFPGEPGHTYGFYSIATDRAGHIEPTPAGVQASIAILGSAVTLRRNGDNLDLVDDQTGQLLLRRAITDTSPFVLDGDNQDNSFTLDFVTGGFFTLPAGSAFHAGEGTDRLAAHFDGNMTLSAMSLVVDTFMLDFTDVETAQLTGGDSDNVLDASTFPGSATLLGANGNDTLTGGPGSDFLTGGPGNDLLIGNAGLDTLVETGDTNMRLTNTRLFGGALGTDRLIGIEQAHLTGGISNNVLNAGIFTLGNVVLDGGPGNDRLLGGRRNDTLIGGPGADILIGGRGSDLVQATGSGTFVLRSTRLFIDGVRDVLSGIDRIDLTGGADNDVFNISGWVRPAQLDGQGGSDLLTLTKGGTTTLSDTHVSLTASIAYTLVDIEEATLVGGRKADRFIVSDWTGNATLMGGRGADTVISSNDADFTLTDTLLTRSTGGSFTLASVERAILQGGAGDNILDASAFTLGSVVLVGQDGDDDLQGGSRRDLLIGGLGADTVVGNDSDDLLIAGGTDHDSDPAILDRLMLEWSRTNQRLSLRLAHLLGLRPGGRNGRFLLNETTVHDDGVADELTGGLGIDWFFALAEEVIDQSPIESLTEIS